MAHILVPGVVPYIHIDVTIRWDQSAFERTFLLNQLNSISRGPSGFYNIGGHMGAASCPMSSTTGYASKLASICYDNMATLIGHELALHWTLKTIESSTAPIRIKDYASYWLSLHADGIARPKFRLIQDPYMFGDY